MFVDFERAFHPTEEQIKKAKKFIVDFKKKAIKKKDCIMCENTYLEYWNNHGHDDYTTHCKFTKECVDFSNGKKCEHWCPKSIDN